eukprot:6461380-Amphidinium_carterae.3
MTGTYVEGLNLKETLARDKERHMHEGESFPMGKEYYSHLKRLFASKSDVKNALVVKTGETADPELIECVMKSQAHPPNDSPLLFFLSSKKSMTQAEYVGLCRYCADLSPTVSSRQLRLGKEMVRSFARTKVYERDEATTKLMRGKFSDILTEACFGTQTRKRESLQNISRLA